MEAVHILLVEDNEGDILLTTEVLDELKLPVKLSIFKDGKEAINFIDACPAAPSALTDIHFILLDINLPKNNGHEVLAHIKKCKRLAQVPVIMLSTSSSAKEKARCLANNAYGYIIKPLTVGNMWALINSLKMVYPD